MSEVEISPMDRLTDLVSELLEGDADPREIQDTVRDAIREWRQNTARKSAAAKSARIVREAVAEGSYCPACKVPWSDCDCEDDLCGVQHRIESDET